MCQTELGQGWSVKEKIWFHFGDRGSPYQNVRPEKGSTMRKPTKKKEKVEEKKHHHQSSIIMKHHHQYTMVKHFRQ